MTMSERVQQLRRSRTPFVHATVVRAQHPTSAHTGDQAILLSDGTIEGFVGGQCAQNSVRKAALGALQAGESVLLRVLPDGEVGFLDWQMVRRGNWSLDLGYFLQGALTIEDRRRGERDLLDEYRAAVELPADEIPTAEGVWLRYRASVAHGLAIWMATLSGGDAWQRPDICLALAQRYSAAFIDLDTPAALNAIDA